MVGGEGEEGGAVEGGQGGADHSLQVTVDHYLMIQIKDDGRSWIKRAC